MNELVGALFFVLAAQSPLAAPTWPAVEPDSAESPAAEAGATEQTTAETGAAEQTTAETGAAEQTTAESGAVESAAAEPELPLGHLFSEFSTVPNPNETLLAPASPFLGGPVTEAEADLFICFTALMGELRDV